jgi:hypothetical protein
VKRSCGGFLPSSFHFLHDHDKTLACAYSIVYASRVPVIREMSLAIGFHAMRCVAGIYASKRVAPIINATNLTTNNPRNMSAA